jgi:hypothetical protein
MITYRTHIADRPTLHTERNAKATDVGELRSDRLRRFDRSSQYIPAPAPTRPPSDPSTSGGERVQSAAEVVAVRVLALITVVLFVTSIVGLTVFSQDGNSTTAIVSGVIGICSAVLGFIVGFNKAYRAS